MAIINGTPNSEVLVGTAVSDTIIADAGNDTLIGGAGNDAMLGGIGDDVYRVQDLGDAVLELIGEGTDTVFSEVSFATSTAVEFIRATGTADITLSFTGTTNITISGNAGNNLLEGDDGNDLLSGREGNDDLAGGNGLDTLIGGEGNDLLRGGLGIDNMIGGAGDDTYRVRDTGDIIIEAFGGGFDTVITVVDYSLGLGQEIEELRAITSASVNLTGNNLANTITSSVGDDKLEGLDGDDTLRSREGDDTLVGGKGNDFMVGGTGSDVFEFQDGFGNDRIQDFDPTEDTLLFVSIPGLDSVDDLIVTELGGGVSVKVEFGSNSIILVGAPDITDAVEFI